MRINSIYISSFGGIKDKEIKLADGFNLVFGENEMGKTTIMSFIKMMFYGSPRASSRLSQNIRQKYTPWDGTPAAGSIDFTLNGKNYRLEKEFKSSNSTDRQTLIDLDLGTRQAVGSDVGNEFFGLSLNAFERSVFIGQFGFPEKDSAGEGEINAKLSNIAVTGDDNSSFEEVNTRLQKAKLTLMSKSGKAGEYDKNMRLLSEINEKTETLEAALSDCEKKKGELATIAARLEKWEKEALTLKKQIDSEQDIKNAEKLRRLLLLKEDLDSLNATLTLKDGKPVDDIYLKKLQFCIGKYKTCEEKLNAKQNEVNLLKKSIETGLNPPEDATEENANLINEELQKLKVRLSELESQENSLNEKLTTLQNELPKAEKAKKPYNFILGGIGIAVGLLYFVLGFIPVIVGALIAVLGFVIKPKNTKAKDRLQSEILNVKTLLSDLKLKESSLSVEIGKKETKSETIKSVLGSNAAMLENQQRLLTEAETELEALQNDTESNKNVLKETLSLYNDTEIENIDLTLQEIKEKSDLQKGIKQEINLYLKDLNNISYAEAKKKLDSIKEPSESSNGDFDTVKREYELKLNDITRAKEAVAVLTTEIKASLKGTENIEKLKTLKSDLERKTAAQKEFCSLCDIASEVLQESFAEVRRSYGSVLDKKAGEIFKTLTDHRYSDMAVSKELDINVTKTGVFGGKAADYLSSGTADQAYLSLRLALSELMSGDGNSLPILLDDVLAQYDDRRAKTAIEFLKEYSKNAQVILFTCHLI